MLVDELEHLVDGQPSRLGDARRLQAGVRDGDVRIEAGAGRGDGVHRHLVVRREAVQLAVRRDALLHRVQEVRIRRAEVRRRAGRTVVAVACSGRPRVEVAVVGEVLADEARADDDVVALEQRPVCAARECHLCDPGHDERVDDSGEHRQRQEGEQRGDELAPDHDIPSPLTTTSISLIPMNGTTMPPSP